MSEKIEEMKMEEIKDMKGEKMNIEGKVEDIVVNEL